ncbi:uncharacterized protein MAM_00581 [Metarhizium album ARSEF 1941]|uniref:Uncharacterized protein n=1 Tax=Metarhizium album (strain ARSEF 1941) TaxID=1081103 RepID=A0A0B2X7U4_METAS|nr:uncharacterized protein MAM_00581 [Metarhizium album ARSEF 1941]KHO01580.1 hypothetical protein MAM_00581 [Metarhizium album ARSEF 1941]
MASPAPVDPVLRNTLRYTISAREYATLHRYVISRSRTLRRAAPTPASVDRALQPQRDGGDDYNARAVRHALRVFVATMVGVKGWKAVCRRVDKSHDGPRQPWHRSPALRLSLSLSSILLLYRFLFRFLSRLRAHLLDAQVEPFRLRNPRTAAALTSPYAPAIGASLAGVALGVCPSQQLRVSVAIYAMFRALEFGWNMCESDGLVWGRLKGGKKRERPWWFGSWMLQPLAFGQLLHAVVFDRDCFPAAYGSFIFRNSHGYLHARPDDWSGDARWPSTTDVVDGLSRMARLGWPAYTSPAMFPTKHVLPPGLKAISPLTSRAHPLITSLSCAALHPDDPSCTRTYLTFWLSSFPPVARFFLAVCSALTLVTNLGSLYNLPVTTVHKVVARALRMSAFATGAISTAWASICFFQAYLPRRALATQRFFLGGFLAGLWAWVERRHGRGVFLYSARASVDSLWKVGVKRRWWRAMRGGDVWVFVLALMVTGVVYERDARAVRETQWRKGVSWIRGEGWRDWAIDDHDDADDAHDAHDKDD